ncbi:hypothetical protein V6N13_031615 [Hibiscus sabdariffa]|uniref:BURP domain-containing protein n=1 Tax=Hibiscus sabdariffa TaxID=183260 RepID=A0ABR2CJU0_9ROSI
MSFLTNILKFVVVLSVQLVGLAASKSDVSSSTAQVYWKSLFPHTPLPGVLANQLIYPSDLSGDYFRAILKDMVTKFRTIEVDEKFKYDSPKVESDSANKLDYDNVHKDVFFFETKLHEGANMDAMELTIGENNVAFLPRSIADTIPFSSQNFSQILTYFSVSPESPVASVIKETIELCEIPALKGELKRCSTSFEDFLDYAISLLGKHVQIFTPSLETKSSHPNLTVGHVTQLVGKSVVMCHKLNYAYAVYLCHSLKRTHLYEVYLIGKDGSRGTSLAACHQDTSSWSAKHLAFHVLKVQPGTVPICHFLKKGTIVWVPSP